MEVERELRRRGEALLGTRIEGWSPRSGGLTTAATGIARLVDGHTVFLKMATDQFSMAEVAAETRVLQAISASFMPRLLAADLEDLPIIALEDLSAGHWPEPYPMDLTGLEAALEELRSLALPPDFELPPTSRPDPARWSSLPQLALRAAPRLSQWLERHEPAIVEAAAAPVAGGAMVHSDLWYSNICFFETRVVFVDWSHARTGSPWQDTATVNIDLVLESRPPLPMPEAAMWAAVWLGESLASLAAGPGPAIGDARRWRTDVVELVDGAAWWAADELGLPYPPVMSDRRVGWR